MNTLTRDELNQAANNIKELLKNNRLPSKKEPYHDTRHQILYNKVGKSIRGIIALPSKGCSYAQHYGACSICGHGNSCIWDVNITPTEILKSFENSFKSIRNSCPPKISLYCSGSLLDEKEIPKETTLNLLHTLEQQNWIKEIYIESLPQYVTKKICFDLRKILKRKKLNIGMGLDCANDALRLILSLKGIKDNSYELAVKNCKQNNITPIAYIIVKSPFLTKSESIWETSESIQKAISLGFKTISLEPIALQSGTIQELLWMNKLYTRPTIWDVINSIRTWKQTYNYNGDSIKFFLGGEVFTPIPFAFYAKCKSCTNKANKILKKLDINLEIIPSEDLSNICCEENFRKAVPIRYKNLINNIYKIRNSLLSGDNVNNIQDELPKSDKHNLMTNYWR